MRRDLEIGRADHEVLVDHGVVDAHGAHILELAVLIVIDRIDEAHAEREVAACVLVKECVVEQQPRLIDRALPRHERALAEIGRALVHGDELFQQLLVFLRVHLHGLAVLEADGEVFDQLAVVAQGLRGIDDALGLTAFGTDEALLGGQVRIEERTADGVLAAAAEMRFGDHADAQVGAVGGVILQRLDAEAVQVIAAGLEIVVVILPRADAVAAVHAAGVQDGFPELLDRAALRLAGEDLFRPRRAGHGGDAPLVAAFHLVAEGLDDLVAGLHAAGALGLIHAAQAVGILAHEIDPARKRFALMLQLGDLPRLEHGERLHAAVAHMQLLQRLVVPLDGDLPCPGAVALLDEHRHKLRLVELGNDDDALSLLHTHAGDGDQTRIRAENGFFHFESTSFLMLVVRAGERKTSCLRRAYC